MADSEDSNLDPDHVPDEGEAADEQRYKQERATAAEASAREALAASAEAKKSDFSDLMADPNAAPGPMVPQAPVYDLINKLPDQAPAPPAPPDYPPDVAPAAPSQSLPGEDKMRTAAKSLLAPAAPEKKKEKTVGQKIGAGLQATGQQIGAGNANLPQAEMPQLQFQQIHLDAIKQLHEWLNSGGFRNG